jgi:hypothetical protein
MMETIKRHLFLVALGGGVAVIALAVGLVAYFGYVAPNAKLRRSYEMTQALATQLQQSPVFTAELVQAMAAQDELRKGQYADVINFIRNEGAARKPLVAGVFPTTTDSGKRLNFKNAYDPELRRFYKELGALPAPGSEKTAVVAEEEPAMYIHPKMSFFRPDWVDRSDAPSIDKVREGQENLWLMADLVGIMKKMNADLQPKGMPVRLANSAIKEIVEIKIGADFAALVGSRMAGGTGRYAPAAPTARKPDEKSEKKEAQEPEKVEAVPRAPTLSGRWSQPGFYQVLPFRMVVVVESRYSGEFIRRLKGTESFISVEAYRIRPVPANAKELMGQQTQTSRNEYGTQTLDRLEVVAESLLFQLDGGRVTTTSVKPAAPPAAKSK